MKLESWLSLIAIVVSLIAVPSSAILTYHYAKKQFQFQIKRERLIRLASALDNVISVSEQLGSLIRTEATQKIGFPNEGSVNDEDNTRFNENLGQFCSTVAKRWPICSELQNQLAGLFECGIMKIINDQTLYDRFVSLYWQLKDNDIKDADKVKGSFLILYPKELLKDLKNISKILTREIS